MYAAYCTKVKDCKLMDSNSYMRMLTYADIC